MSLVRPQNSEYIKIKIRKGINVDDFSVRRYTLILDNKRKVIMKV